MNIFYLILPPVAWFLRQHFTGLRGIPYTIAIIVITTGAMWYSHVYDIQSYEADLEARLYAFDLDGDGGFTKDEITPEAERLMQELTTDTGRSFGLIAAGPIAIFSCVKWFLSLWGCKYCWLRYRGKEKE